MVQNQMTEKYRLQYLLLVKEFVDEVEKGREWQDLRPILLEMKKINHCLECLESIGGSHNAWELQQSIPISMPGFR